MKSNHLIEPMRITDFDEVTALWKKTEGVGLNESDNLASTAVFLDHNPNLSLIARDPHGKIIAAVLCGHDGRRGYLHHLAVATEHRRQGLGKALVNTCLSRLATVQIHKCNIFLYANNTEGRLFWERLGWTDRMDLCMMQKPTR